VSFSTAPQGEAIVLGEVVSGIAVNAAWLPQHGAHGIRSVKYAKAIY
jgi:hypothetical protein